jgi:hypothetical protein
MTTLIDLLNANYAPIQSSILSNLNADDVTALTRTYKSFADLWPTLRATDYNINLRLRKLFKDPRQFRSVQGQCNALIIGNESRWLMSRSRPTFSNLAITVAREDKWALVTYLLSEGYGNDDADDDVEELPLYLTLVKKDGDKSYRIIIISNVCALIGAMYYSHTTAELNFISWNRAFSMFPNATFVEQKAYLLFPSTQETERIRELPRAGPNRD